MRVKVIGKACQQAFRKLKEGRRSLGQKTGERGRLIELVGNQNPGFEAPPRSKKGRERREQRRCQRRSHWQRSDGEELVCHGIEGEEVRRDDPVEYFPTTGSEVGTYLLSPREGDGN